MNGKGSKPRPFSVSYESYSENFDAIFKKKAIVNSKDEKNSQQSSNFDLHSTNKSRLISDDEHATD